MIGVWIKQGVVIPPGPSDNFNGGALFGGTSNICALYDSNPQLISANSDGKVFKAWFQGANDLCYAESHDGISWTRKSTPILTSVGTHKIYLQSGTYYLYATPNAQSQNYSKLSVYTSADGINFTLQNNSALAVSAGWDSNGVLYLQPFYKDGSNVYHGSYSSPTESGSAVGIATSTDLINWTNAASAIATNFGGADAHVIGGRFYIWGGSPMFGRNPLTFIQSTDLVTWSSPVLILPPTINAEGGDGGEGMGPASVIEANGKSYLFYTGTDGVLGSTYKTFLAIANAPLSTVVAGSQGMLVTFTKLGEDTFQRPDEAPLSDSGNWLQGNQGAQANLTSHLAVSTTPANASRAYWTPTFPADQYSQITLASDFNSSSIVGSDVRNPAGASNTQYEFFVTPTSWTLRSIISGTANIIASGSATFSAGDVIGIAIINETIFCLQNGTLITVQADSNLSSGNAAIIIFDGTPGNTGITDWQGGATNCSSAASSGSGQSAPVSTAFASKLVLNVKDSSGANLPGVTVTFAAPGSGASATFAGGITSAVTDASGNATSAVLTANATGGSYNITATANGLFSVNFQLNNTGGGNSGDSGGGDKAFAIRMPRRKFGFVDGIERDRAKYPYG